jgi:hypothetical protein
MPSTPPKAALTRFGKYVESIDVAGGSCEPSSLPMVARRTLAIRAADAITLVPEVPARSLNGDVVWVCGGATVPANTDMAAEEITETTVSNKYLPASCREGFGAAEL